MENKGEEATDIRHLLAIERTVYAIERTFFAYISMSLTLTVCAITFINFTNSLLLNSVAWVFIPSGITTFVVGLVLFLKRSKKINRAKQKYIKLYHLKYTE